MPGRRSQRFSSAPWVTALALIWAVAACGSVPVPSESAPLAPATSPSMGELRLNTSSAVAPTPTALLGAAVSVSGSGSFHCFTLHGCRAFFSVHLSATPRGLMPNAGDTIFALTDISSSGLRNWVVGPAELVPPSSLPPGDYTFAGIVDEPRDLGPESPNPSEMPSLGVVFSCIEHASVTPSSAHARVHIEFTTGSCQIHVTVN